MRSTRGVGLNQVEMPVKHDCWGTCCDRIIIRKIDRTAVKVFSACQWYRMLGDWKLRWCAMRRAKQRLYSYAYLLLMLPYAAGGSYT